VLENFMPFMIGVGLYVMLFCGTAGITYLHAVNGREIDFNVNRLV
jgi:hypothetical protein